MENGTYRRLVEYLVIIRRAKPIRPLICSRIATNQVLTEEMLFSGKLEKKLPRGSASLGVRYSEYTDLKTDKLTQKTYGGELGFSYELLPRLTAKLDFVAERYDYEDNGGHTNRIFVNPLLRYELPREISVSLEYMFVDYDSPTIVEDNRRTNRAMVELAKVF